MKSTFWYLLVLVFFWSGASTDSCDSSKNNEDVHIVNSSLSPDKKYTARYYSVSGGGAAGYVYMYLNIQKSKEEFNPKEGVVFCMSAKGYQFRMAWEDDNNLKILHAKDAKIYFQKSDLGEDRKIHIKYDGI